jgi:4-amino-4-deoxy-L-arabinose transferase-like glycosyltransferase
MFCITQMIPTYSAALQSVNLPVALFGSLSIFVVMLFAAQMWNRAASIWCGIFMGLSLGYMRFAQTGTSEVEAAFFYLGALLSAGWILASPRAGISAIICLGLCGGLAVLGGSPVGLLLVVMAATAEAYFQKGLTSRKIGFLAGGLVLAAVVVIPWASSLAGKWAGTDSWISVYLRASILSSVNEPNYLRHNLLSETLPWAPLLLIGWIGLRARMADEKPPMGADELKWNLARYLLAASMLALPIIIAAPWRPANILLCVVPLAAASGYMISRLDQPGGVLEEKIAWLQLYWTAAIGVGLITSPIWLPLTFGAIPERFETIAWIVTSLIGLAVVVLAFTGSRLVVEARHEASGLHFGAAAFLTLTLLTLFVAARDMKSAPPAANSNMPDLLNVPPELKNKTSSPTEMPPPF